MKNTKLGRYSFLTADPFDKISLPVGTTDPLQQVQQKLERFQAPQLCGLPPFQGGAAGLWSYDLGHSFEEFPTTQFNEFSLPALFIGLYDTLICWDHQQERAWIISQGFPETKPDDRRRRATERIAQFRSWIDSPAKQSVDVPPLEKVHAGDLAPQYATAEGGQLTSNFTHDQYCDMIQKGIDYIYAGDAFQINLSQRLLYPSDIDSPRLYQRLRQRNAATFSAYFDIGDFQILSTSPERLFNLNGRTVEARPIKGTRQRTTFPEADLYAGNDLKQSEKDIAENVMIVDLLRNDLSRVCHCETLRVTQLCQIEIYQYVQHLVSAIRGNLKTGLQAVDIIQALFPGGSITGAPKIRAMEIISELEPTARGAYCGSLGYVGFDGTADLSILIRTITAGKGWWQIPVGGGVVAQSTPQLEFEETWQKALGMLKALK